MKIIFVFSCSGMECSVFRVLSTPSRNTITYHNALCLSPEVCLSIVFSFSWGHFNSQEKLKTLLMQNFGVTNKEHYGILWYFLEWSIGLSPAKPECLLKNMTFRLYVHFFLQATPPIDFFWFTQKFKKGRRYRVNYRVRCQYPNIFSPGTLIDCRRRNALKMWISFPGSLSYPSLSFFGRDG